MEKIDTDYKQRNLKSLAKLFKTFNRDCAPLTNCGQKFFCLQTRRIDISPPLLDKLRITATNS